MRHVVLDGKAYRVADILRLSKEQQRARSRASQLTLFELKEDARPATQTTARGRFEEPSLF
jgi:hypothetical protein